MPIHFTPFTGGLLLINLITFAAYGYDKFCARRGAWRVPEIRLLFFGGGGGQPGSPVGHVPVPAQDEASEIHHRGAGDPGAADFSGGEFFHRQSVAKGEICRQIFLPLTVGSSPPHFPLAKRQNVKYNRAWENLSFP